MGIENNSVAEPENAEFYEQQAEDLIKDRARAEEHNLQHTEVADEKPEVVEENKTLFEVDPYVNVTVTEQQKEAKSPEGKQWQLEQDQYEDDLYKKNLAWTETPTDENYQKYIEAYDKLARHHTKAWHDDKLTEEEVYNPYKTNALKPKVDKVEHSILLSGNLYFNQIPANRIKEKELEDMAKTLAWERLKNPAVVDFEFAQGFRVNLWMMDAKTRENLEKKVQEIGGNNYKHLEHFKDTESTEAAAETQTQPTTPQLEAEVTSENNIETDSEDSKYSKVLQKIKKNGITTEQDQEDWAGTINDLLELNDLQKAKEVAGDRIKHANELGWSGNDNEKMVNALILASTIAKRDKFRSDSQPPEEIRKSLAEHVSSLLGKDATQPEIEEFLKLVKI
ncbi:MAG: hypothetical protein ACD_52C00283G0003 [uncultured bacterium]|uniref:Uncharacterized protein n=1 Tax=candidate division WWE3 bacterium TaxID=2053526 RepID=A0A3D0ZQM3_UNCKA|nr:MAG: hypothetical protein ACD_52C00283G0003 [uncultured bacterium]OGC58837.1 MAG: hypothetical protein A2245_02940 [candidate division WWE3 bacterium RIFOXYA2_FULL_43_12]OGC66738.1 MAG: hypothetical protein A2274_01250 [candidate division WWE3 bacterium RIFOXYA12_FULL_43_11]OGC73774.1 MAG: hypothetical protein A2473_01855 [candidate division WWE3 bacterium RIFOXYC2_FULL_42_13]OGC75324.1 MAG: hypothetical protein A2547_03880 [candidate division WWE3 bacterium RIFOXYD2_FULL_43_10]HCC42577.1 h